MRKEQDSQRVDSARHLARRAYYTNDYVSQDKVALHAFQAALCKELQSKYGEQGCKTLEMEVETVKIQE